MKKGGNPQKFLEHEVALADKPVSVKLPIDLDKWVRSLPNRTEWLRNAIAAQYERDMQQLNGSDSDSKSDT